MKKVIEYRNITGIKYSKDSEYMPGEFIKFTDTVKTPIPIAPLKPVEDAKPFEIKENGDIVKKKRSKKK